MKVLQLVCYALAAVLVTTVFESCSSGLGNNLPNPDSTETSQASTNFPLGVELGVELSSPAEDPVVAGVVIPAFGANTEREVVLVAFATESDGVALSRDTVTDGNAASDVFAAVLCAQEVETAAFSQSLAGKFRHPRCATCHSMRATGTTAFQSASAIGQPHAGPLPGPATFPAGADECIQCHTQQTSFPVVGWQAPDESFNFKGKTVAELAQAAMNVPFDETEHFVTDPRVLWALDSGILPVVGGRNGVADDDHDGIDEPTDTDGIARPVPGGSEVFLEQIEDWRAAGMPVTPGDAVCDVTLVSRAGATTAAPNGASSKPQVVFVPNGAFTGPGTVGTLFVVFQSDAGDVVGTDTNGASDVFVTSLDLVASGDGSLDLQVNGAATLCSEANGGGDTADGASSNPVIGGAAGDMVAFESEATDLVAGFVAGTGSNVYVHQVGGSTTLVSHTEGNATTGANGASSQPSISADGTRVAFESDATDLLSVVDANGVRDVFYADVSGAAPFLRMRASVTSSGGEGSGGASGDASVAVTGGGRTLITFESDKTNLDGTVTAATNVYLYDSQSNATLLLNRLLSPSLDRIGDGSARNPVIGPDGATVAFESDASNIDVLRTDQNNATDVFLVDTGVALGGAVLPYRFSLTTVEAADADGASTMPQFGTFASPSSNYQVGFAVYKTEAGNLGTTDSNDLVVAFLDETSGVVADLSASVTSGVAPLTVQFTDQTTGVPTAWQWDFDNDGNVDSTEQNPSFTYTTPGTYTVVLTAANASSSNTATKTDLVRAIGVPTVDFAPSVTGAEVPFSVTFSDNGTTEQPTSWSWDFGDGTTSTTAPPVTHTYTTAGTYTVALTATNEAGSSTETKTDLIQAVVPINASFTTNPSPASGAVPLVVDFDASGSAGATTYAWDFGDGSSGTGETTQHTYTSGGVFTVTLTATGPIGNMDTATASVSAAGTVNASFTLSATSAYQSQTLSLDASASTGSAPLTYEWDFDDDNFATVEATGVTVNNIDVGTVFPSTSQTDYPIRLRVTASGGGTGVTLQTFTSVADSENATLIATADNTIFSNSTNNSNGAGDWMVIGNTNGNGPRRALVQFDVAAALPANATVNTARVRLKHESPTGNPTSATGVRTYNLHRVTAAWTEGTSENASAPGLGAASAGGGATWNDRIGGSTAWASPGGDFVGSASGSITLDNTFVVETGPSSAGLVSDVQAWLDTPANNFGWLIKIGNETPLLTAKWIGAREIGAAGSRPALLINYTRALP